MSRRVCVGVVLALGITVAPRAARAQLPITERLSALQHPRGLAWYVVETPHFRVIYPDSLGAQAQRAAGLLEASYAPLGRTLGAMPKRIPVVLNVSSMTANAYVAWGPRRSQWYPSPGPTVDGVGPLDWYTLLAVHEGRHIAQEQAVRSGWIGLASRVFGDNAVSLLGGALYFPAWFWEGDAVGLETALTQAGRGRQPSFTARIRALKADGQAYEYYPAWQGSYRTAYPDWYELGYILTSYVRRQFGDSAWRRVIRRASWNPLAPWAMSMALKRETGRSLPQLHRAAVATADSMWTSQRQMVVPTAREQISPANAAYHVWSQPQVAGDGSLIAAYTDLNTVTQLVRLAGGRREVLVRRIGLIGDQPFHVRGMTVVWSEYEADPRYGERNFLGVRVYDLERRKLRALTRRTRLLSPALSPDGRRVAAVELNLSRETHVVVLDLENGAVVQRIPNATGGYLATPSWTPDGRSIDVVRVHERLGNQLVRQRLDGSGERTLVDFTFDAISRPVAAGGLVYFASPRSGLDNVWGVDTTTGAMKQVSSRPFGAMWPSVAPGGEHLYFSDYGPQGYEIARMSVGQDDVSTATSDRPVLFGDSVVTQEAQGARQFSERDSVMYPVRPYRGLGRLFAFHSLAVAPTSDALNTGFVLESRNVLNTLGVNAGVVFNTSERTSALEVGASYAGLPVIFDGQARLGSRVSSFVDTTGLERRYTWSERSTHVVARLPLTRLWGQQRQSLALSLGIGRTQVSHQPVAFRNEVNNGVFTPVSYQATASHVRAAAYRDLFQTGASLTAVYRHTPFSGDYVSRVAAFRAVGIAPGVRANDALVIEAAHEEQRPGNYRFSSEVPYARGFNRRYFDRLTRVGVSYDAPLWYPDLAVGSLVYVRRVRGSAFADWAHGRDVATVRKADARSLGTELSADLAPLGTRTTMRVGVRLAQRLTGDKRAVAQLVLTLPQ